MINRRLYIRPEIWELKEAFKISRGIKTEVQVVKAALEYCNVSGYGEAAPYAHYGETVKSVMEQLEQITDQIEDGIMHDELQEILPAGAARNLLDCALWDLEARWRGKDIFELLQVDRPNKTETAVTIVIGTIEEMAKKAEQYAAYPLLKIKLDRENIKEKISAIREKSPHSRIIIDPNESWTIDDIMQLDDFLFTHNIALLEQPLAAAQDEELRDFKGKIPICADESCHISQDLEGLIGKYQAVNIKLDKTGGLTEALKLKQQAIDMGFDIMVGCMVSTSLAMAPAMLLAGGASFIDLDGPIWMKKDRKNGLEINQGLINKFPYDLWGGGIRA